MEQFEIQSSCRTDFINITNPIQCMVTEAGLDEGVITVFVPHTTAGITINENADPDVVTDMKTVFDALIPWENKYRHAEGNTAAHVKSTICGSSIQIIVSGGRLQLGTWQSVYFCEFDGPRHRKVWVQM